MFLSIHFKIVQNRKFKFPDPPENDLLFDPPYTLMYDRFYSYPKFEKPVSYIKIFKNAFLLSHMHLKCYRNGCVQFSVHGFSKELEYYIICVMLEIITSEKSEA